MAQPPTELLISEGNARAYVVRGWAPAEFVNFGLLQQLAERMPFTQEKFKMFGKPVQEARPVVVIGEGGRTIHYSGIARPHIDWMVLSDRGGAADLPGVSLIRQMVPFLEQHTGHPLNSCLINFYRDGKDYLSYHRDPKTSRQWNNVATVSVGGSRRFEFQRIEDKKVSVSVSLNNGDLMVMTRDIHELWRHGVPTQPGAQPRASLTFRYVDT